MVVKMTILATYYTYLNTVGRVTNPAWVSIEGVVQGLTKV